MPAPAVLALVLAWASVPLALTGPAGIVAGLFAFFFRSRFRRVEAEVPGHRGARWMGSVVWLAGIGVGAGLVVSAILVAVSVTTTTSAK